MASGSLAEIIFYSNIVRSFRIYFNSKIVHVMLSTEMCKHISIRTLHLGSGLWLWLVLSLQFLYLNILGYLGTTLTIERAASNGSFDPPEGYEDDKRRWWIVIWEKIWLLSFSEHLHMNSPIFHTNTHVQQFLKYIHVVLCSRWVWRLKKQDTSVVSTLSVLQNWLLIFQSNLK